MADITATAAKIKLIDSVAYDKRSYIAVEALTAGQAVYFTTAGKVGIADANAAGKQQFRGIALESVGAESAVSVLHSGEVEGFTLSGNADTRVYLSDTAGSLADSAGTMTVIAGRVVTRTNDAATKVLRVDTAWTTQWA